MDKGLISVIVPVYNGQDYLEACVNSIEGQTYPNVEILIINDGSTDGTAKVCEKLLHREKNIRLFQTNDEGVSVARNAGIDAAKGEFLTFVDADDRLFPDALQLLYDALIKTGSDISGCGFVEWSGEAQWTRAIERQKTQVNKTVVPADLRIYRADDFLEKSILSGNSRCWSKLYRKNVIGQVRFRRDLTIGEDMLFLVDLLSQIRKTVEIPYQGYAYYQNPVGAMKRTFHPKYMDQISCWEIAREQVRNQYFGLEARMTSILLISIMLTVGKLAVLSSKGQKKNADYVAVCHEKLCRELQVAGAYELLPGGYRLKTKLFAKAPQLYLWLYHFHKYKGMQGK